MLEQYCSSLTGYSPIVTRSVMVGNLSIGGGSPIRIQTMTTTDTMDTMATVMQCIRCIEAGAELVRITAPSKTEAENLRNIKNELKKKGYSTPLIADIHFTPNAAEIAARIVEKVRINPGNYIDKKKFEFIEYTDADYAAEVANIYTRFAPLVRICKEYGTAMRIGVNHGSLSDRIMSRYGDSPAGMVESAMEFIRIARNESYHSVILSMKSSNPLVMIQAYRLLVHKMNEEFQEFYPLHLGVTEAGDGEDGRIKSAIGIGSLLEDGIGDTIRVSLTEDPEFEIPVCRDIVVRYAHRNIPSQITEIGTSEKIQLPYNPFSYRRRDTVIHLKDHLPNDSSSISVPVLNIGSDKVPIVIADFSGSERDSTAGGAIVRSRLVSVGYSYNEESDKWTIADNAADYLYIGENNLDFELPGLLQVICDYKVWHLESDKSKYLPMLNEEDFLAEGKNINTMLFVLTDVDKVTDGLICALGSYQNCIPVLYSSSGNTLKGIRKLVIEFGEKGVKCPVVIKVESKKNTVDKQLIDFATETGALLCDGIGDGLWLTNSDTEMVNTKVSGRTYLDVRDKHQFLNNTAFTILQATRTRISKTEYISCPSCGRTLFDLQQTTSKIRNATQHLKGVKIAIMGCIVNGPGEMADADFGYVGSGIDKITLYKGKEVVKKNITGETAVDELINLLKESGVWVEAQ